MAKNPEELYEQKEFERRHFPRPTEEQLEIAALEQQLQHAQNTIGYYEDQLKKRLTYSESDIDKLLEQRGQIIEACRQVSTDTQFSDGLFKDRIMAIMGWKR